MSNGDDAPKLAALTTEIVAAYVGHNSVAVSDIGMLVGTVGRELGSLGIEPEQPAKPEPAVPVRSSVRHDHLVCLVCGKPFKSLRRHLGTAHGLTSEVYREMYGLARNYPMVAAASSEQRAEIAKRSGLGLRHTPEPIPTPEPEPVVVVQPEQRLKAKPIRGRRSTKKSTVASDVDPAQAPQPDLEQPRPKRRSRANAAPTLS